MPRLARNPHPLLRRVLSTWLPSLPDPAEAVTQAGFEPDEADDYCHRCGATIGSEAIHSAGCPHCRNVKLKWQRIVRLGQYTEPLSQWIIAMKFGRVWTWGPWLGRTLGQTLPEPNDPSHTVLCPVPLHWMRRWSRGFNQARLIAQGIGEVTGIRVVDLLRRVRPTAPHTRLANTRRAPNVRGAFAAEHIDLSPYHVWLVDDVKTTASTLNECIRTLAPLKPRSINIAVAAVADPANRDFKHIDV